MFELSNLTIKFSKTNKKKSFCHIEKTIYNIFTEKNTGLVFTDIVKGSLVVGDRFVITPFLADWTYQTNSIFTSKKVKDLKDLSVTLLYTFLTGTMEIPLVSYHEIIFIA